MLKSAINILKCLIQSALSIHSLFICGSAYSRSNNCLFSIVYKYFQNVVKTARVWLLRLPLTVKHFWKNFYENTYAETETLRWCDICALQIWSFWFFDEFSFDEKSFDEIDEFDPPFDLWRCRPKALVSDDRN